jgi:hypothetical protein
MDVELTGHGNPLEPVQGPSASARIWAGSCWGASSETPSRRSPRPDPAAQKAALAATPIAIKKLEQLTQRAYLDHRDEDPKPFIWTASADSILAKLRDCKAVIETFHFH